ncbi:insulin-like growth factor-binding protein 3 receptor [Plectropomus leopardus]|uniref:insulin-like growth factor-binding protein 3 receptor n=1 Tax=Plectropomus leopardus TaxID=160734 RepID=UPI001C4D0CB7|nr:insulin-like growth factor-binding protein 3 receptor [Plectropomus leopardus]
MMGFWQPVTNLKDYISQNPPAFTFFLCLLTLATTLIGLSSYGYTHTLPNPDTVKDWNHLLSSLSQFQLCVKANASLSELVSPAPSPMMDTNTSLNSTKTPSLTTLHLKVPLAVSTDSDSGSLTDLGLHTALRASQLHLGGNETVNVTLDFFSGNNSYTCLTISAPTNLLPMSLLPPECPASEKNISPIHMEASNQLPTASQTCYSLHSETDPALTVMLTKEEQIVAVRHLLEVGFCLLGVCLILCVAASLTQSLTRHYHWNGLDLQNEPLVDS